MQAAVQEPTQTISSDSKDVAVEFENFLAETVKNSNTYRQKREKNFLDIKVATINYLDEIKSSGKVADYKLELTQSGVKQMGIYLVGKLTLITSDGETIVTIKNKMNTWNHSGDMFVSTKRNASIESEKEEAPAEIAA